jgi:peptidoglycan L-alanyl-D-glutamate endopeptidase CwlK
MNIQELIEAVQAKLGVTVDGAPGPETWRAIYEAVTGKVAPANDVKSQNVDPRSAGVIAQLQPQVQPYALALLQGAAAAGIEIKLISGHRTYAEQDALFAQGRTRPGKKVTNAKGGESNHNFGIAFDVGVFDDGKYLPETPSYDAVGVIGKQLGLDWGGDWANLVDKPHFELRPAWAGDLSEAQMLAELRRRTSEGSSYFA